MGESLSSQQFSLRSDPFAAGLECTPFLVTGASGQDASVFDNGLPLERTDWISDGCLAFACSTTAPAWRDPASRRLRPAQPHP